MQSGDEAHRTENMNLTLTMPIVLPRAIVERLEAREIYVDDLILFELSAMAENYNLEEWKVSVDSPEIMELADSPLPVASPPRPPSLRVVRNENDADEGS